MEKHSAIFGKKYLQKTSYLFGELEDNDKFIQALKHNRNQWNQWNQLVSYDVIHHSISIQKMRKSLMNSYLKEL